MQITIQVRNVFGLNKAYPACDRAQALADIAGTKTLTPHTLRHALRLGFDVVIQGNASLVISAGPQAPHDIALLELAA